MDPSRLSNSAIFAHLRDVRLSQKRLPAEVLHHGEELVQRGALNKDNSQVWDTMEQLATAAIESGQLSLATVLISRLASRFSDSAPRVATLQGMLLEGRGELRLAREFYEDRLRENESDVLSRKRLCALHLSSPLVTLPSSASDLSPTLHPYFDASLTLSKGIALLTDYLDTYYTDHTSWLTLSSSYARLSLYPQALSAASHAVLLQPNNGWVHLKYAELAYTAGEVEVAWKGFLRVIEMSDDQGITGQGLQGPGRRAAMGAKLCLTRLRASPSKPSASIADPLLAPKHLDAMEVLLTRLLLDDYSKDGAVGAGVIRKWLGSREGDVAR